MNLYNVYEDGELFLENVGKRQITLSKIGVCSETIDKYVDTPNLYKKKYRFEAVITGDMAPTDSVELFKIEWEKTCTLVKKNARKREQWNKEHGIVTNCLYYKR